MPDTPGFDPGASTSAPADFGSLTDPQLAAIYGLDKRTAALPVVMQRNVPVPGGFGPGVGPAGPGSYGPAGSVDRISRYDEQLGRLARMNATELEVLQRQLYAGGFFSKSYYGKRTPGVDVGNPDDPGTIHAFKQALNAAVRSQNPLNEVINSAAASRAKSGFPTDLGSGGPRVSVSLTNPADLRSIGHTAANKVFGRQASQQEIRGLTAAFHQQEIAAQTAAQDPMATNTTQAPNATAFAEQFFQQNNPKGALTQNYADGLHQVLAILGDSSTGKAV